MTELDSAKAFLWEDRAMADCKYCGTEPNHGETDCASMAQARNCPWMGESDWRRYHEAVDKARAWDAIVQARADEREACAKIALAIDSGRGNEKEIARAIRSRSVASPVRGSE